jgi:TPR repeat protein
MPGGLRSGFLAVGVLLMTALAGHAEPRTFTDLLARAEAQAAAGHRWAPAGDNMAETVISMMDLIPTASPAEVAQLSALLESEKSSPTAGQNSDVSSEEQSSRVQSALTPPAAAPPAAAALPAVTAVAPARAPSASQPPTRPAGRQDAYNQVGPSQMAPGQMGSSPIWPGPTGLDQTGPDRTGSRQTGAISPGPGQIKPIQMEPGLVGPPQTQPAADSRAGLLFARGLDAERRGDFSAARRFYLTSAQHGDAAAARNLGRLYDPAYLGQTALGGIDPDPALARRWYERAVRLGDADAGPLLEALSVR